MNIPFKKINLGNSYETVKPLFESGFIGLGDVVFEFEQALAEYVGAKYVVTTSSCTAALFLCLLWEREKNGVQNVFIPSMTHPLVYNAAYQAGLNVAFDARTDWVGRYYRISGSDVVDSAEELRRDQFKTMSPKFEDLKLCFSFYPTKTIGSADGGAIATDNKEFAEWARSQTTYGRSQQQFRQSSWNYDISSLGHKLNWNNLQAAIALEQLKRLDQTNERRQTIVKRYDKEFLNSGTIEQVGNGSDYLYRIDVNQRDYFLEFMQKNGIECGVHFKPMHLMKPYKDVLIDGKERVEEAYQWTASLPLYDLLTDAEVEYIIRTVQSYKGITAQRA